MSEWVLTKGLQNLRDQVNAVFPDRDHTSDGTIGDSAHQAETSGHNPDDTSGSRPEWDGDPDNTPEVRAWDMDNNLAPGFDCQVFVDHIRRLPNLDSVIRYIIYNRRMYHERNGFQAAPYTGASPHTEHVHFSGAWTQASDNNNTFNYRLDEIPVTIPDGQMAQILGAIKAPYVDTDGTDLHSTEVGFAVLTHQVPNPLQTGTPQEAYYQVFVEYGKTLALLVTKLDQVIALLTPKPGK